MRAARVERFGGVDVLHIVDTPMPVPGALDVLIRV